MHLLHPLFSPGWCFEGVREILGLVYDLAVVVELHNTHGEGRLTLVGDDVFGDPEVGASDDASDLEAGWFARMMGSQGLEVVPAQYPFAGLGVITDGIIGIDVMFGVGVAGCRGLPVGVQGFAYLLFLHGLTVLGMGFR